MRQELVDFISGLTLGTFTVSSELPWSNSGVPLYLKNFKKFYVDVPQITTEQNIVSLSGCVILNEITTVRVFLVTDAKQLPNNYETVVSSVRTAKDASTITGYHRRECDVTTSYDNDALVTEFEFRFTKLS